MKNFIITQVILLILADIGLISTFIAFGSVDDAWGFLLFSNLVLGSVQLVGALFILRYSRYRQAILYGYFILSFSVIFLSFFVNLLTTDNYWDFIVIMGLSNVMAHLYPIMLKKMHRKSLLKNTGIQ